MAPNLLPPCLPAQQGREGRAEGCVHACAPTHARFPDSYFMYLCVNIFWIYSSPYSKQAAHSTDNCSWPASMGSYSHLKQRLNNDLRSQDLSSVDGPSFPAEAVRMLCWLFLLCRMTYTMNAMDNNPRVPWWMHQEVSPGPFPVKSRNQQPRKADVAQGCISANLG